MSTIAFATCRSMPALQPDDVPLAEALRRRGHEVRAVPWNGPFDPFGRADVVAVRSTWDYFEAIDEFEAWLHRLDDVPGRVFNSPSLMRWNARKSYLVDLAGRGAPLPPTRIVAPAVDAVAGAMDELALQRAVVKPIVGAGASGLSIVDRARADELAIAVDGIASDVLVQPLLDEIRTIGETSLTFFAGRFSHAVVKRPASESILVQAEHGGSTTAVELSAAQVAVASDVLALLPEPAGYARVDIVFGAAQAMLMEVEVLEPELFALHDAAAPERFADLLFG